MLEKFLKKREKKKEALELELTMLEAEPNRKILVSIIEGDVALNKKLIGLRADEVRAIAAHYVDLFDKAMAESEAELEEMRAKAEQKKERARVRAAQRKREKAAQETAHRSESVVR